MGSNPILSAKSNSRQVKRRLRPTAWKNQTCPDIRVALGYVFPCGGNHGRAIQSKDRLDLTVDAFLAELDRASSPHALTDEPQTVRSAMQRALATWALLHRTPNNDDLEAH